MVEFIHHWIIRIIRAIDDLALEEGLVVVRHSESTFIQSEIDNSIRTMCVQLHLGGRFSHTALSVQQDARRGLSHMFGIAI